MSRLLLGCAVALKPPTWFGRCATVIAHRVNPISGVAFGAVSGCRPRRPGGHLAGELADPAHALGGRLRVVTELLCHPADAAMDAELPHGGFDCLRYPFGARGIRSLQPFTGSLGKSFETLARRSVSQANHDLAGRVQPN